MPGDWDAAFRAGVVSVIATVAIAAGSIVFAAFQGHALASDVAEYEKKNDLRITALEEKFADHLEKFETERVEQARFRGEVSAKLELILGQKAQGAADATGG